MICLSKSQREYERQKSFQRSEHHLRQGELCSRPASTLWSPLAALNVRRRGVFWKLGRGVWKRWDGGSGRQSYGKTLLKPTGTEESHRGGGSSQARAGQHKARGRLGHCVNSVCSRLLRPAQQ